MKITIPSSFLLILLCSTTLAPLAIEPLHAVPPPRQLFPKIKAPGADVKPVAYAKSVSLPKLIQKVQTLANEVQPENSQAQLLPVLIGSFLGDPSLSSISPGHSCNLIFFDDLQEKNATVLGLFKLNSNSPIVEQIKKQRLSAKDIKGWTMVTNNPALLTQIKNWSSILRFAEWQPPSTLEFGFFGDSFRSDLMEEINKHAPNTTSDEDYMVNLIMEEFANLDSLKFSISLLDKNLSFRFAALAREGTELDKLFLSSPPSLPPSEQSGITQFVQGGGWLDAVVNLNVVSHARYLDYLLAKLEKGLQEKKHKELVSSYSSMIRNGLKLYSGHSATSYGDIGDGDFLGFMQVGSTDASISEFEEALGESNTFFDKLLGVDFFPNSNLSDSFNIKPEFEIKKSEPIEGTEVLSVKIKIDPAQADDLPISSFANQTVYYSVHQGKYVAATSKKAFKDLLRAVKSGKPLKNNLSKKVVLGPKHMAAWRLDLFGYTKLMGNLLKENGLTLDIWEKEMKKLSKMHLPRISGRVGHGGGQYFFQASIPVKTIRGINDLISPAYIKRANEIREKSNGREAEKSPTEASAK